MYLISDKKAAIRQIQRLCGLNETGFFDTKTRQKIIDIQKEHNLPATGIVDYHTFTLLVRMNKERNIVKMTSNITPLLKKYPYKYGDLGNDVQIINNLLAEVIKKYKLDVKRPSGKFFNKETSDAVRYFRKIMLMEDEESINETLINRIIQLR